MTTSKEFKKSTAKAKAVAKAEEAIATTVPSSPSPSKAKEATRSASKPTQDVVVKPAAAKTAVKAKKSSKAPAKRHRQKLPRCSIHRSPMKGRFFGCCAIT